MSRKTRILLIILPLIVVSVGVWLGWRAVFGSAGPGGKLLADPAALPSATYRVGEFSIRWDADARQFTVESPSIPGYVLWQTLPGRSFVQAAQGTETVREARGMFRIRDTLTDACGDQEIRTMAPSGGGLEVTGSLHCRSGREILFWLAFESPAPHRLDIRVDVEANRAFLTYASSWEEHFFGFGEQFSYVDMRGRRVPIWVSEQGVGRGDQPITFGADVTNDGAGGTPFTTYAPVPFYMTSHRRALALLNTEYTVFDLRRLNWVQIGAFSGHIHAVLLDGSGPREFLTRYTDITGRPAPLPDWVHSGAIVGMQGGTEKVRQVYQALKARGTPIAAFWLQDWVGQRKTTFGSQLWWNWEVDEDRYPGWDDLVADLKADGVRVMVYVNPNLVDVSEKPNARRNLFQEALEKGYLVRRPDGSPYLLLNTSFYYGMVDLTNPEAVAWLKEVIREQVVGAGASGWMADFAEALPYDAVLANGDAAIIHNQWPVLWARLNREVVEESGGDLVFFTRAGFTGSQGASTLFWEGDQLVSWGRHDGIKSAVTGLNSSGLSGFPFNHSDIGGYTTVSNPIMTYHRSEELLMRWMEMNAFTLIFRTHEGNQPEANVQFYSSDATLDAFARWAKVYAALFEYRKTLIDEAARTGMPVVRHPLIQYPEDPIAWSITYQEFMLGPDFLIAPVLDKGATRVKVYLPFGDWVHLWSGRTYTGCQHITVDAPLGQPAVFYRKGSRWGEDLVRRLQEQGLMPGK